MTSLSDLHARLRALGTVTRLQRPRGGHSSVARALVELADGRRLFVKLGGDERGAEAVRREAAVYTALGRRWHPRVVSFADGAEPFLVLEDLSSAVWPPPWPPGHEELWRALDDVASAPVPPDLPALQDSVVAWQCLQEEPGRLTDLSLDDEEWIDRHVAPLAEAAASVSVEGVDLVHSDLAVENLCYAGRGPVIVDWEFAASGNPWLDVATISLDLLDAGLPPAPHLPSPGAWASLLAGIVGVAATSPLPEGMADAERLRGSQRRMFRVAVTWAAHHLGVPPPSGW